MAIFSSFASLFSGQPSSSKSSLDEPTLAQAAHNRTKSKGKMALVRQDSDLYTQGRPYGSSLADDFSSRVSLQVNGAGGPGGLVSGDISRPGSPAAPGSAFLGSNRSPTPPPKIGGFSYPPQAPATYSHLSGTSNSPAIQSGGSPVVYRPAAPHPHAAYPPLHTTWSRLRSFLGSTYPDLEDSLNLPAPVEVINELELRLNMPLPSSVRESYLCADGQDVDGGQTEGLFFGLALLPLEDVLSEWTFWRSVESDPATGANPRLNATMGSYPQRFIKKRYASRGWLPLISDRAGNYIGVDLDPGPKGEWGQVIIWGRDFDNKCVLWRGEGEGGWGRWLEGWVTDLENGDGWELEDANGNDSTGSEDDVGYSSYFHDPTSGRSGGDVYGDSTGGLRMAGEYRGWAVLEAVWDKSVKQWDAAGLLRVEAGEEDEFGVEKDAGASGLGLGVVDKNGGLVEVEASSSGTGGGPAEEGGFIGEDKGKRLLVSTLPSTNTGIYPADERDARLLSPPSTTPSTSAPLLTSAATRAANSHARTTSNAPEPFDLPTRTDVIAAEAVALAEGKNLRGGWVMSGLLPERNEPERHQPNDIEAGSAVPFRDDDDQDKPPGSGTLSPNGHGGVLGFLGRRPSAEGKLPQELPLPMSLPPSPAPRTFSPPLPTGSPVLADGPPPARVKSPLSNTADPVELGRPIIVSTATAAESEEQAGDDSFDNGQPTVRLVGQQSHAASDDDDDGGDGELMDVSLGGNEADIPAIQDDKKGKLAHVFGKSKKP